MKERVVLKSYFRYIRGKHGKMYGAVQIDEVDYGHFKIGLSILNPNDEFSKQTAHYIANQNLEQSEVVYDFYELIDNDWYADIAPDLPHRGWEFENEVFSTIRAIADDVIMDYAREHYKRVTETD